VAEKQRGPRLMTGLSQRRPPAKNLPSGQQKQGLFKFSDRVLESDEMYITSGKMDAHKSG
jgi:hypothetical protein